MSINIGSSTVGSLYLGSTKIGAAYIGNVKVYESVNYNPLNLPAYTMRFQFSDTSYDPTTQSWTDCSWQRVSSSPNVWDYTKTANVTDWSSAFSNKFYTSTNRVTILGANTTGVTTFSRTFYSAKVESVALFDTRSVTAMDYMFANSYFTTIPPLDTSSVTNMNWMLSSCHSLQSIPLLNTSSVTTMNNMFNGSDALQTIPLLDTSSVTSMLSMFFNASAITSLPALNTSSVTNMRNMMYGCSALQSIPNFDTSSAVIVAGMCSECTNATGALSMYNKLTTQTNPPTDYLYAFLNCGSNTAEASNLNSIPVSWGGNDATNEWHLGTVNAYSSSYGTCWGMTKPNVNFVDAISMSIFTTSSIGTSNNLTASKSSIANRKGSFSPNITCYIWPCFVQFDSSHNITAYWAGPRTESPASETSITIPGTLDKIRFATKSGGWDSNKTVYLCWVATNLTSSVNIMSNSGILKFSSVQTSPDFRIVNASLDPQSAYIPPSNSGGMDVEID